MAVEGVRRGLEGDIRPRLDHPDVLDALRKGNINDVLKALPSGITKADIEEYLKHQWLMLDQALLQNVQIKADEGTIPPVTMEGMSSMSADHAFTAEDRALLQQGLGMVKAASVGATPVGGNDVGTGLGSGKASQEWAATGGVGAGNLTGLVEEHLTEFNNFMIDIQNKIFETQITQELEAKKSELQKELQRIIALMRAGQLDPEYVLIALARVQISERGLLFTQNGRRMMHASDEQKRIAQEISAYATDVSKLGQMEVGRQEMGEKTMQMQQTTSLMQKLTQDVESIFAFAKGASESIINTKREITRHIGASAT